MTPEDRKRMLKYLGVRLSYEAGDKDLLLKDLCGRLPYGVICLIHNAKGNEYNINIVGADIDLFSHQFISIKPYLRPMSSMTEEEMDKVFEILHIDPQGHDKNWIKFNDSLGICFYLPTGKWVEDMALVFDYLNSIHIDYRGLIPMGLALEAKEGMYRKEEK